jgi:Cu/Zn superoxide dismutase
MLTEPCSVNPFQKTHGAPSDDVRHVGDLGNFKTDAQGNGKGSISDSQVKLIGENSVIGVCQLHGLPRCQSGMGGVAEFRSLD